MARRFLALSLALAAAGCDGWPGLEKSDADAGVGTPGASQLEDSSGRLGSSCGTCQSNLACLGSFPNGMCTRDCQSNADCGGGVCVPLGVGVVCLPTCLSNQTCRPGYSCQSTGEASVCAPGGGTSPADAGAD